MTNSAANDSPREASIKNLISISPFFIVEDLPASTAFYRDRLGFQLDFQGPKDDVYYARVSREGIGIMLKTISPDVLHVPTTLVTRGFVGTRMFTP